MTARISVLCLSGEVQYNALRRRCLRNADGVVFVADSGSERLDDNLESLALLEENLRELGQDPKDIPLVFQWNKADLDNAVPPSELDAALNRYGSPTLVASAETGEGVVETNKALAKIVFDKLSEQGRVNARLFHRTPPVRRTP